MRSEFKAFLFIYFLFFQMHCASSKCICRFALVGHFTQVYQLRSSKKQEPRRDQTLERLVGGLAFKDKEEAGRAFSLRCRPGTCERRRGREDWEEPPATAQFQECFGQDRVEGGPGAKGVL